MRVLPFVLLAPFAATLAQPGPDQKAREEAAARPLTATEVAGQRLDFKGLMLGTTPEAFRELAMQGKNKSFSCRGRATTGGEGVCRTHSLTIANEPTGYVYGEYVAGRLSALLVDFDVLAFDRVAEAVVGRYGKPHSDEASTVENRMGSRFDQRTLIWDHGAAGRVTLQKRSGEVNKSAFMLADKAAKPSDKPKKRDI